MHNYSISNLMHAHHSLNLYPPSLTYRLEIINTSDGTPNLAYVWWLNSITPLNLSSIMTAPIPTALSVPTTSYTYPQELPSKLVKKILDLEFVEMAELVPDSWREEEADGCLHSLDWTTGLEYWTELFFTLYASGWFYLIK